MARRVLFDTNFLSVFVSEISPADFRAENPGDTAQARIAYLIERLAIDETEIVIPTPVLAEISCIAGADPCKLIQVIDGQKSFRVADFNRRSAIEFGILYKSRIASKPSEQGKRAFKFDMAILAIAKTLKVSTIYTSDGQLANHARLCDISPVTFQNLPIRPSEPQLLIHFPEHRSVQ